MKDGQALGGAGGGSRWSCRDGLEVEWLGVSGYRISLEGQTLFIDPYLSRVPFGEPAAAPAGAAGPGAARPLRPRARARSVGVLVGHTHFDHAVDAPAIARRFGARPMARTRS